MQFPSYSMTYARDDSSCHDDYTEHAPKQKMQNKEVRHEQARMYMSGTLLFARQRQSKAHYHCKALCHCRLILPQQYSSLNQDSWVTPILDI